MVSKSRNYWAKEKVFEEMCKYKNITQFKKKCSRGYVIAKKLLFNFLYR